MGEARVLGVIPARIGSTRLPRKPLLELAGRPLIDWVWRRVRSFDTLDRVVVATDAPAVMKVCRALGAEAVLTSDGHESGTERVAEVAARAAYDGYDVVVNIQGDQPFIPEAAVRGAARLAASGWDVGTAAAPVGTVEAWRDPAVVKVVRAENGRALYFSRASIPWRRAGEPTADELATERYLKHVGVYAYSPAILARWVRLPPAEVEAIERLEQLRPLVAGFSIGVVLVDDAPGGVDTPEDVRRAEARLNANVESSTLSEL